MAAEIEGIDLLVVAPQPGRAELDPEFVPAPPLGGKPFSEQSIQPMTTSLPAAVELRPLHLGPVLDGVECKVRQILGPDVLVGERLVTWIVEADKATEFRPAHHATRFGDGAGPAAAAGDTATAVIEDTPSRRTHRDERIPLMEK
ncbi:MAG TPA: hypothetical protein VKX24_07015 [Acidimicrobiia bacterium]|nr:hypothetical protein [Acidimicrobiia bacterium]HZQ76377.1 hypothetical protein [Acidimicrobiia bacterium]